MTRLLSCEIAGLAGRRDTFKHDFNDDVNVFFGLNGSGKSSLLKILCSAVRNDVRLLRDVPFRSATVSFFSDNHRTAIVRSLSAAKVEVLRDSRFEVEAANGYFIDPRGMMRVMGEPEIQWNTRKTSIPNADRTFTITYLSISRMLADTRRQRGAEFAGNQLLTDWQIDQTFALQLQQLWKDYASKVNASIRQTQDSGIVDILQSLFIPESDTAKEMAPPVAEAYRRASEFLSRRKVRLGPSSTFSRLYEEDSRLQHVVGDIVRLERQIEIADEPRRELQRLIERFLTVGKQIEFKDDGIVAKVEGVEIPLSALSSGEKQLARVLVETVSARNNTVVIDEPELSMHIDWQRELVGAMRTVNPTTQIVLATHSPEIMAELSDDKITRL